MTKAYEASTKIEASPAAAWRVLVDVDQWPQWDPYCDKIEGKVALGQKVKAFSKLSPGRAFPVKVSELVENQKMVWSGGMPLGLFKGVRTFTLSPDGEGTRVHVREEFSGPMLALFASQLPDMTEPFEKFVAGWKARVESAG